MHSPHEAQKQSASREVHLHINCQRTLMKPIFYYLIFCLNLSLTIQGQIESILRNKPDEMKRLPSIPTDVYVGFYIKDLFDISSESMQYKLNYYYYLEWTDPRCEFNVSNVPNLESTVELDSEETLDIFLPDVFVKNAKVSKGEILTVSKN